MEAFTIKMYIFVKNSLLKNLFLAYKPFLVFLIKFLTTYVVLSFFYQLYLSSHDVEANEVDGFTQIVAEQTRWITQQMGYEVQTDMHPEQPSVKFMLNNVYISRIVEGCNALAVMILFMAFVIAFKGKLKKTIAFIALGLIAIHLLNIVRIALISIAIYHYPQYQHFLHGVLFPLIIYGFVFVLWVLWVKKYSLYAADTP